ncbi:MAG: signal peptidase I [Candidatus Aenigmatarchaeota archaeon]
MDELKQKWNELVEGPAGWIIYLLLGIGLALLLNGFLSLAMSTDYPVVTVKTNSMVPTLNPGDIVFVRGKEKYDPGDIIVFDGWMPTPLIHRSVARIEKTENGTRIETWRNFSQITETEMEEISEEHLESGETIYVTKGDNNSVCDQCAGKSFVHPEEIHGHKVVRIPYLGWIKLGLVRVLGSLF